MKPEPASSLNVDSSSEIPSELAESKAAKRRRDVDISSDGSEPKAAKRRRKSYSRKSDIDGLVWQGLQEELRRRAIFEKQMLDLARQNLKVMRAFQRDFSVFVLRNQSKWRIVLHITLRNHKILLLQFGISAIYRSVFHPGYNDQRLTLWTLLSQLGITYQ